MKLFTKFSTIISIVFLACSCSNKKAEQTIADPVKVVNTEKKKSTPKKKSKSKKKSYTSSKKKSPTTTKKSYPKPKTEKEYLKIIEAEEEKVAATLPKVTSTPSVERPRIPSIPTIPKTKTTTSTPTTASIPSLPSLPKKTSTPSKPTPPSKPKTTTASSGTTLKEKVKASSTSVVPKIAPKPVALPRITEIGGTIDQDSLLEFKMTQFFENFSHTE